MVLKKSNTRLNSGATQKCFHRRRYRSSSESSELTLTITLLGLPSTAAFDEKNPSTEHAKALEKIYDFLNIRGPSLKTFYESTGYRWNTSKYLNFSLNKRELWDIPERIENLMKLEHNFADKDEEPLALTRVTKVRKVLDKRKTYKKESCELNSDERRNSSDSVRNKRRIFGKNRRGVQRPHLLTIDREETDQETSPDQTPTKIVEVEVQDKDHFDARALRSDFDYTFYNYGRRKEYHRHAKGCVNGKQSYRYRMYNPVQMKHEISSVVSDISNKGKDLHVWDDSYYDDFNNENEAIEGGEEHGTPPWDLSCYHPLTIDQNHLLSGKNKLKRKKRKENLNFNEDIRLVNVNRASSKTTIKYPKGSIQFIERDGGSTDITSFPVFVHDGVCDVDNDGEEFLLVDHTPTESNNEKIQDSFLLNRFEVKDDFIAVNLEFPKEFQYRMTDCLFRSRIYTISIQEYSVTLGNCYPPVFCVDLDSIDSRLSNGWSLIGISSSDVSAYQNLKWKITLKNTKFVSSRDDNVKNDFFKNLELIKSGILQFDCLIQIALVSVQTLLRVEINKTTNVPNTKTQENSPKNLQFVSKRQTPNFTVCSMEEAANKLQTIQSDNNKEHSASFPAQTSNVGVCNDGIECDICFDICHEYSQNDSGAITLLPCNHTYCYECWQSHIFYHLMSGDVELTCMHTDCRQSLNDTVVKSFVPEHYLVKLYAKRRERSIETSPLCQWCPYTGCNQVAMVPSINERVQKFGMKVDCDCKTSWCFSCKSEPHWPISCSQAEAYKNLLRKVGEDILLTNVTFNVDLKPCPGCKYPVEKSEGCPHMVCTMCGFNFCWKCLESTANHTVWSCSVNERSTFVTYQLHNEAINDFPLKFLRDAIDVRKRKKSLRRRLHRGWLNGLSCVDPRKIKRSFHRSMHFDEPTTIKLRAIQIARDSSRFLFDCYGFLEYFYLVYSFALLNNETDIRSPFNESIRHGMNRLIFVAFRLEDRVIGKSIRRLYRDEITCQMYLENGRNLLEKLKKRVGLVQKISKDVPAEPIGQLDPKEYYYYK